MRNAWSEEVREGGNMKQHTHPQEDNPDPGASWQHAMTATYWCLLRLGHEEGAPHVGDRDPVLDVLEGAHAAKPRVVLRLHHGRHAVDLEGWGSGARREGGRVERGGEETLSLLTLIRRRSCDSAHLADKNDRHGLVWRRLKTWLPKGS